MRKRDVETLATIINNMRPHYRRVATPESTTARSYQAWLDGRARIMNEVIPSNRVTLFLNLCPKEQA